MTRRKLGEGLQLRLGQAGRLRFVVQAPTPSEAQHRCAILRELAKLLVDQKRYEVAPKAIQGLADAYDPAEFEGRLEAVRELCSTPRKETAESPRREITFQDFGEMWTTGELARRFKRIKAKKTATTDASRLKELYKTLGPVPLERLTHKQIEEALNALPERVKTDSTRRHYEQIIAYLMKRAVHPCGYIERNPIGHIEGFRTPKSRPPAFPFLYPSEDLQLLACRDIELGRRMLYGFTAREGWRKSDSFVTWGAFDLERGIISSGVTKTGEVREWELFPGTREALVAYRKGLGDPPSSALVFPPVSGTEEAQLFRDNLWLAGVRRPQLHDKSPGRMPIRFHDLRASFITIALACGRTEAWITDRTGHTTSQQMYGYKRHARLAARLGDWTPLDQALGLREQAPAASGASNEGVAHDVEHIISDESATFAELVDMAGKCLARPVGFEPTTSGLENQHQTAQRARSAGKTAGSYTLDYSEGPCVPPSEGRAGTQIALDEQQLTELLDLARAAKRWHLLPVLGAALDELARAAAPNVSSLDEHRRRRGES